jgi:hypothetical protein
MENKAWKRKKRPFRKETKAKSSVDPLCESAKVDPVEGDPTEDSNPTKLRRIVDVIWTVS